MSTRVFKNDSNGQSRGLEFNVRVRPVVLQVGHARSSLFMPLWREHLQTLKGIIWEVNPCARPLGSSQTHQRRHNTTCLSSHKAGGRTHLKQIQNALKDYSLISENPRVEEWPILWPITVMSDRCGATRPKEREREMKREERRMDNCRLTTIHLLAVHSFTSSVKDVRSDSRPWCLVDDSSSEEKSADRWRD